MSHAATNVAVAEHPPHDPHLAHHFDTPDQQYQSGKLGMWIFLATEILMFGGLFVAYSVYRHNHPDVFAFAHKALDPVLGGINTVVLITSSLTMAWGVRAAQLGQKKLLLVCLFLTILGGAGFMGIKTIEYEAKWKHHLFPGWLNVYNRKFEGEEKPPVDLAHLNVEGHASGVPSDTEARPETQAKVPPAISPTPAHEAPMASESAAINPRNFVFDGNAGTPDEPKIKANFAQIPGLAPAVTHPEHEHILLTDLDKVDRDRVSVFFSVYFLMTGLHGIHVLVGMGLISWIFVRAWKNEFGPTYFTPVDLVGLYWHLVDLIWIFLFPLLYLIH